MGPTASGKTHLAIELTQHLPCDIISVDSAMVYRGMDIGTAKPTQAELTIAPHRLIDIADPADPYSAGQFYIDAKREIEQILSKGRIPLLVGGTMLYFRALQCGLSPLPTADATIRQQIVKEAESIGWPALHQRLSHVDPTAAANISPQDAQRIQRALEIYQLTGYSRTDLYQQTKIQPLPYRMIHLGLISEDRVYLAQKIAARFQHMLQQGFIEEVAHLKNRGDLHPDMPSMRAVGYRQIWDYLEGHLTAHDMQERAIIATRQLAKRQMTWLRSWTEITFLAAEALTLKNVLELLKPLLNST